ncbi:hypothetical protein OGR47_15320 [Methylocystis sp. MJC1]|uniref:hypothetical protein n=1 Tax=Methylocystis sp. MJC1 TaxID=2654282 RepID=UPI0013EB1964|nr:hypothetical protein [Methylocystis sp. MJC1]MBU6528329.1 hypothetical protein [Methylocystis sp. MJC1]UZX11233.1 hypothetical protein OGR47_15320 [Methylocystis sp. MJC1]
MFVRLVAKPVGARVTPRQRSGEDDEAAMARHQTLDWDQHFARGQLGQNDLRLAVLDAEKRGHGAVLHQEKQGQKARDNRADLLAPDLNVEIHAGARAPEQIWRKAPAVERQTRR